MRKLKSWVANLLLDLLRPTEASVLTDDDKMVLAQLYADPGLKRVFSKLIDKRCYDVMLNNMRHQSVADLWFSKGELFSAMSIRREVERIAKDAAKNLARKKQ